MLFNWSQNLSIFLLVYSAKMVCSSSNGSNEYVIREFITARQIFPYEAYKDMQVFYFNIPIHTVKSIFNMTSNSTEGCPVRNITVYLQAESLPLVSPDGAKFPKDSWTSRQPVYQSTLISDLTPALLSVDAPQSGDWFMVAFFFEDSNRIIQAGIFTSCDVWLQIDASHHLQSEFYFLETEKGPMKDSHFISHRIKKPTYYRFFVAPDIWYGNIVIQKCKYISKNIKKPEDSRLCPLSFVYRPLALPSNNAPNTTKRNCYYEALAICNLTFTAMPGAWYYVKVSPRDGLVQFQIGIFLQGCEENKDENYFNNAEPIVFQQTLLSDFTNMLRSFLPTLLNKANLSDTSVSVTDDPSLDRTKTEGKNNVSEFKNRIHPVTHDIEKKSLNNFQNPNLFVGYHNIRDILRMNSCGESYMLSKKTMPVPFSYEFEFAPDVNSSLPLMLNLTNQSPTILNFDIKPIVDIGGTLFVDLALAPLADTSDQNYTIHGCLNVHIRPSINYMNGKISCDRGKLIQVNSSDSSFLVNSLLIPYPEPGRWYLILFPSCYLFNQSNLVPCRGTNGTTVLLNIVSTPCIMGECGNYGTCSHYISGGVIYSTCVCDVGYRGYDCSDGSKAIPDWKLLLSTLFLCLSNLFFIPAIVLAYCRRFYTEAVIYAFTMFFSTFYHACDASLYNFCLMRLDVLQFCDFYSAILAFWVTLIVMANLPQAIFSILHLAGAMLVALGVENDRTGLWVFAVPTICALTIMFLSWGFHTRNDKSFYPPRKYLLYSFLPGILLAIIGLICFAFFETKENYFLIHSLWHIVIALSILCLLPSRREEIYDTPAEDDGEYPTSYSQDLTVVNLNLWNSKNPEPHHV